MTTVLLVIVGLVLYDVLRIAGSITLRVIRSVARQRRQQAIRERKRQEHLQAIRGTCERFTVEESATPVKKIVAEESPMGIVSNGETYRVTTGDGTTRNITMAGQPHIAHTLTGHIVSGSSQQGCLLSDCAKIACELAEAHNHAVQLIFNKVPVMVLPGASVYTVITTWYKADGGDL